MHKLLITLKWIGAFAFYGAMVTSITEPGFGSMENLLWWLAAFVLVWGYLMGAALGEFRFFRKPLSWHLEDLWDHWFGPEPIVIKFLDDEDSKE